MCLCPLKYILLLYGQNIILSFQIDNVYLFRFHHKEAMSSFRLIPTFDIGVMEDICNNISLSIVFILIFCFENMVSWKF